ncbi:ApeI family dehydratase [Nannocystis pusilla]|uniref:ApeI family dehydratase n=1 Tax=Nannocystis pusilla TaxID=889268 RepID=UPI003DA69C10
MRDRFDLELVRRSSTAGGETATFAVGVPADLLYFAGHFPGEPVLPGVAQLVALVLDRVHALWPELGEPTRVGRLKFKQPIAPGDALGLTVELERGEEAPRVHFQIDREGQACTVGVMTFATAAESQG